MAKKKPDDQKHFFAAIPARAVGDKRLKGLHWSTLSTIALHDRMGRNGQGCWAGDWRLKDIIGCDYARLSTTLTELYEWGYIDRRPQPKDRRKLTYFVVYDDAADGAVMKAADSDEGLRAGKESGAEGLRAGKRSEGDGLRAGKSPPTIVCTKARTRPR